MALASAGTPITACTLAVNADAVLCASIFHYGEFTIGQAKAAMAAAGIEVR